MRRTHAIWILGICAAGFCIEMGFIAGIKATRQPPELVVHITVPQSTVVIEQVARAIESCTGDHSDSNWLAPSAAETWKYFEGGMYPYRVTCE
jgi:hypothetical protein